ncbi:hypothetical protein Baya_0886 [Bagarius yarrelli]|uniref:Uncharacterized protein n=1 Tax=Bagarius yarrelli TaxID=175774 RepID=A0A556TJJ1_BAGYA|nr:hypothetical protein Baya_0886 [Bagarius yarrelli]
MAICLFDGDEKKEEGEMMSRAVTKVYQTGPACLSFHMERWSRHALWLLLRSKQNKRLIESFRPVEANSLFHSPSQVMSKVEPAFAFSTCAKNEANPSQEQHGHNH